MNYSIVLLAADSWSSSAPLFLFIIIGSIVLCGLMFLAMKQLDKHDKDPKRLQAIECLNAQAQRRGGFVKDGASELTPELIFRHDDRDFTVSLRKGAKHLPNFTFVAFQTDWFPDSNFRIASKKFKALISLTRIKDFHGVLDGKYEVEGNDAAFVRAILIEEIQIDLLKYEEATEIRFGDHVGVSYNLKPIPGRFYLSSENYQTEDKDYYRLIETTVKFYERLKLLASVK